MPKKDKDSKVSRRKTDVPVDPPIDTRGTVIDAEAFGSMEEDLDGGKPRSDILIVGIGASAGGLRAFKSFRGDAL